VTNPANPSGWEDPAARGYPPAQPYGTQPDPFGYPPGPQYPGQFPQYPAQQADPYGYPPQQPAAYVYPQPVVPVMPVMPVLGIPAVPTSGMATASMVLGIVGVVLGWCMFGVPSLLAIIFGHLGLNETRSGAVSGRGMAIAGLVLGYIAIAPMIYITVVYWGLVGHAAATGA
jgi:hypothetical protein